MMDYEHHRKGRQFLAIFFGICLSACATAPESPARSGEVAETEAVLASEAAEESLEAERLNAHGQRPVTILPPTAEERQRYFWGPLQMRADAVFEELSDELLRCVTKFGAENAVRELAFEARRASVEEPFAPGRVVASPEDHPCAEEMAERFVNYMGSGIWDGFDHYVIAVIARVKEPECGEDVVCATERGIAKTNERQPVETAAQCESEVVEAVQRALRSGRSGCLAPRNNREQAFLDDPLVGRAVIMSDLFIAEGQPLVVLNANRSWALSPARCIAEGLEDLDLDPQGLSASCRARLPNQSVTYSDQPVFTFVK